MLVHAATRCREHVVERRMELGHSATAHRDRLDHRDAELLLELGRIQLKSVALGEIDHVQRDDRRQAELDQLKREAQMIVEVRGVEHDDQGVGLALAFLPAEQDIACDGFVGAGRIEAVGAGKIHHFDRPAISERQPARLPLNRYAGIVARPSAARRSAH